MAKVKILIFKRLPEDYFTFIVLTVMTFLLSSAIGGSFKFAVVIALLSGFVLSLKLNNLFAGFFLVTVFGFQFINPSKIYNLVIIPGTEISNTDFSGGRILNYGINLSNILLLVCVFFLISEAVKEKYYLKKLVRSPLVKYLFASILFVVWGVGVSLNYSVIPLVSIIYLFGYTQVFIGAFLLYYFYKKNRKKFYLFYLVICISVFFQFLLSIVQLGIGGSLGLPIESTLISQYSSGVEENNLIFRSAGTFLIPIELAIVTLLMTVILFPEAIVKKNILFLLALLAGFATLVLTQSRINWVGYVMFLLCSFFIYRKEFIKVLYNKHIRRLFLYLGLVFASFSFIVFPRIFLSFNTFSQGGGIGLRKEMLIEGFDAFIKNPFIGYGPGTNEYVLKTLYPNGVITTFPLPVLEGHLQLLMEIGLIGVFFLTIPFYIVARRLVNNSLTDPGFFNDRRNFIFTFWIGLLLINIHYLFQSHNAQYDFTYLGIILGFGFIAAYSKN